MTAEQAQQLLEKVDKQNEMLAAIIKTLQAQCLFQKNTQDALVLIGSHLVAEQGKDTLLDMIDTIAALADQTGARVDEIGEGMKDLAEAFSTAKKGNVTDLLCEIAADTEKIRDAFEDGATVVSPANETPI